MLILVLTITHIDTKNIGMIPTELGFVGWLADGWWLIYQYNIFGGYFSASKCHKSDKCLILNHQNDICNEILELVGSMWVFLICYALQNSYITVTKYLVVIFAPFHSNHSNLKNVKIWYFPLWSALLPVVIIVLVAGSTPKGHLAITLSTLFIKRFPIVNMENHRKESLYSLFIKWKCCELQVEC